MRGSLLTVMAGVTALLLAATADGQGNLLDRRRALMEELAAARASREAVRAEYAENAAAIQELHNDLFVLKDAYTWNWAKQLTTFLINNTPRVPGLGGLASRYLREAFTHEESRGHSGDVAIQRAILQAIGEVEREIQRLLARNREILDRDVPAKGERIARLEAEAERLEGLLRSMYDGADASGVSAVDPGLPSPTAPPGGPSSAGEHAALAATLTTLYDRHMSGDGKYEVEYLRPWQFNPATTSFEANVLVWKVRPSAGEEMSFRRHAEVRIDNPAHPLRVSLAQARAMAARGSWQ